MKAPDARVFAALGDPIRLRLVVRLSRGKPLSITELASGAEVTRQAITKHLHVLAAAGVATSARRGREERWSIERRHLAEARQFLDRIAQQWDDRLASLKALVEDS